MEARTKGAKLERKFKGVLRQTKDELLNRQNLVPERNAFRQVKNLAQEGDLLQEQIEILPAKNHSKLVNSKRMAK